MSVRNFEEVVDQAGGNESIEYIKPAQLDDLGPIEGTLVDTMSNEYGLTYILETDAGTRLGVNGFTKLDGLMSKVESGTFIQIQSLGLKPIASGKNQGKSFRDVKVAVATSELPPAA